MLGVCPKRVSIRHADFLLFELRDIGHGWLLCEFQSAMRIFCCSNYHANIRELDSGEVSIRHADFLLFELRPACLARQAFSFDVSIRHADFLLFEPLHRISSVPYAEFQSAMRIFCCSNGERYGRPVCGAGVSIRHADFLLFERRAHGAGRGRLLCFNPPCGFFVVRTVAP